MSKLDRTSWFFVIAGGALVAILWALLNRPYAAPLWPEMIDGISFSPFQASQSPEDANYPDEAQLSQDLELLAERFTSIRTYSVESTLAEIPRLAGRNNLDVTVGIWLNDDLQHNENELQRFADVAKGFGPSVTGIVVGNEVLLRQELTPTQLIEYVNRVKLIAGSIPVTVAETWDVWLKHPELSQHVDYLTAHILPYWEGIPVTEAPRYVVDRYHQLQQTFADLPIVLGEVGWPSDGRQYGDSVASLHNQAYFFRHFLSLANQEDIRYFALEAFDQVWKTNEGAVGQYWGLFNAEREPKHVFSGDTITPVNDWPITLLWSVVLGVALLLLLLRDSAQLRSGGRIFLVLVAYALACTIVWLIYDYMGQYLNQLQLVVSVVLLFAALSIVLFMLIEAHEWAETLWRHQPDQTLLQPAQSHAQPKVSIHVPIHNEPPALVIKTLQALQRLEYSNYEVIVVDNNTLEEAIWRPVQNWCETQGGPFRFHHVDNLEGYKAGALNLALEKTSEDAEVIGVIDSDYVVSSDWLKDCIPMFANDNVAIVQAPQDYHDANENLFKSMIYCEYAGFFGIGMVNRDTRNAIIQHGTMTLVRRHSLQTAGAWSQWCITEDAELGLRILEDGHRACYVPKSYGRGVMPDNFMDYKKQRFRWAYGSVLIMRHHAKHLSGLFQSRLTKGQRYHFVAGWLPWIADAMSLLFNLAALCFSFLLIIYPDELLPPPVILSALPVVYFAFKLCKMLVLYRSRMQANIRQSLAAACAGLALSHTVARAVLAALHDSRLGFFRTPKVSEQGSLGMALRDVREEALLGTALILSALAMLSRSDTYLTDMRLWIALLLVQSVPYLASVLLSFIGSHRNLKAIPVLGEQPSALPVRLSAAMKTIRDS